MPNKNSEEEIDKYTNNIIIRSRMAGRKTEQDIKILEEVYNADNYFVVAMPKPKGNVHIIPEDKLKQNYISKSEVEDIIQEIYAKDKELQENTKEPEAVIKMMCYEKMAQASEEIIRKHLS